MTPVYLAVQAFGPYLERQELAFGPLVRAGLVLIHGETGAGKTVLLDAISFALYGRSSGGQRGELAAMRTLGASDELPTEVLFDFDLPTGRYRFTRSLRIRRKRSGEAEPVLTQNALRMDEAGGWEPLFDNPRRQQVEQQACTLLGLDWEQFCQVMILPQGQFERLLTARSEEKEAVLVSLFHADRWQQAADAICERSNVLRAAHTAGQEALRHLFESFHCADAAELAAQLAERTEEQTAGRDARARLEQAYGACRERATEARQTLELFEEQDRLQARGVEYAAHARERAEQAGALERARQAAALEAPLVRLEELARERTSRAEQEQQAKSAQETQRVLLERAHAAAQAWEARAAGWEQMRARITCLRGLRTLYAEADAARAACEAAAQAANCAAAALACATGARDAARAAAEQTRAARAEILERAAALLPALETEQATALLAVSLRAGVPCPVCGSLEHPAPHEAAGFLLPASTDATLRGMQEERASLPALEEQLAQQAQACEARELELLRAQEEERGASAAAERACAGLELLEGQLDPAFTQAGQLEPVITALVDELAQGQQALEHARAVLRQEELAQEQHAAACRFATERRIEAARRQEEQAAAVAERMAALGFADARAVRAALLDAQTLEHAAARALEEQAELLRVETRLRELGERLAGARPDPAEQERALQTLEEARSTLDCRLGGLEEQLRRLKEAVERAAEQTAALEEQGRLCDRMTRFGRLLRGDSGISLRRYLLGVMLSAVTAEANSLLRLVHGGRYQLRRVLEASGRTRKAGLELEVFDGYAGEPRPVAGLSGGEKFLVSLTLALGLSTVAQTRAGGARMDAIFIDEGFGTLDPRSVTDALEVLAAAQVGRRMVAIISHLPVLRETIQTTVEAVKLPSGSRLIVHAE